MQLDRGFEKYINWNNTTNMNQLNSMQPIQTPCEQFLEI